MSLNSRALIALGVGLLSFRAMAADLVDQHVAIKNVTPQEAEVWKVIDEYWGRSGCCGHANIVDNGKYLDYVSDDALVWAPNTAGVENKNATIMWTKATKEFGSTRVQYELYPQNMVIHDNVAVAFYRMRVLSVSKATPDKQDVSQGRYVDVLVRDRPGATWKYLTYVRGDQ